MIPIGAVLTIVSCVSCAILSSTVLLAQNPSAPPTAVATATATHWCFRGHPKPDCDVFWLTEAGVAARVSYNRPYASGPLFTWELGWMVNRGTRRALGVAAFAQAGSGVEAIGIRPRLRFWMSPTISLDAAPGIVVSGSGGAPGLSAHAALNLADYAALTTHVVALRPLGYDVDRSTRVAIFTGGRLGSAPGTIVGLGGPLVLFITVLIVCGSGACYD